MELLAQQGGLTKAFNVSLNNHAHLGEVAGAMGLKSTEPWLWVDSRKFSVLTPVRDVQLRPGSILATSETVTPVRPRPMEPPTTQLALAGGWNTTQTVPLGAGNHVLTGERPDGTTDEVVLTVTDESIVAEPIDGQPTVVNGAVLTREVPLNDGAIMIGDQVFTALPEAAGHAVATANLGSGPELFNRPPRTAPDEQAPPITLPERPEQNKTNSKLSWSMMLAPIPIGVMMWLIFDRWYFMVFVAMTPIMALGRWIEGRRNAKQDAERFTTEMTMALGLSHERLTNQRLAEEQRLRRAQPALPELRRRAERGTAQLWERTRSDPDFLRLSVGWGTSHWEPPISGDPSRFEELAGLIAGQLQLNAVPLNVDLETEIGLGIVGPRAQSLALAQAMVLQAVTLSGPSDVELMLVIQPDRLDDWEWAAWLPHLRSSGGRLRVATSAAEAASQLEDVFPDDANPLEALKRKQEPNRGPIRLLVVDHDELATAPGSAVRAALTEDLPARGIVVTDNPNALPRACGAVVTIKPNGRIDLHKPNQNVSVIDAIPNAIQPKVTHRWSRCMARFADPDCNGASATIPQKITLTELRGASEIADPHALVERWESTPRTATPSGVIGVGGMGPLDVDIVRDGPHALMAGTTGAGKSELLRTMVTSMAAQTGPDRLNFVLIDFKGGGAFDVCADLPHVVSVVTDLDEHLAGRALRCLKAELRWREEKLRDLRASDITEYLKIAEEPLPRLVVIIDEFATLAVELPDFIDSLIDVAQRGRSLGVHMVLATQRPSGVVDKKIKANTNLRIALRVQDEQDSDDVIGNRLASDLSREQPGRAYARFGSSEVVEFQTAIVSLPAKESAKQKLTATPLSLAPVPKVALRKTDDDEGETDAQKYTAAIVEAFEIGGYNSPRVPWPDPLPENFDLKSVSPAELAAPPARFASPLGLADLPDRQRQDLMWWTPEKGNQLLYGLSAPCLSRTLSTYGLGVASYETADNFHLYVFDFGNRGLAPLEALPHCGAYVTSTDVEKTDRLLDLLETELGRRRMAGNSGEGDALTMILVDNFPTMNEAWEERGDLDSIGRFGAIMRDGPALGIYTMASSASERGIPMRVAGSTEGRLVFRMADPNAYVMFGLKVKEVPNMGLMRAMDIVSGLEVQIADHGDLPSAVNRIRETTAHAHVPPPHVRVLETQITIDQLDFSAAFMNDDEWRIPVGVRAKDLGVSTLNLAAGEHALVAGPPRSGRSSALIAIAESAKRIAPRIRVLAVTPRRSPLANSPLVDEVFGKEAEREALIQAATGPAPTLVLVDDASSVSDGLGKALEELLAERVDHRHIVASGRPDSFRGMGHWTRPMREARNGVLLTPSPQDGDICKSQLPMRRPERMPPGRGFIINQGVPDRAQLVLPDDPTGEAAVVSNSGLPISYAPTSMRRIAQQEPARTESHDHADLR